MPPRCLLVIAAVIGAGAGSARANLRAPKRVPHQPSSVITGLVDGFVVHGETLTFACDPVACRVKATYAIEAKEAASAALQFILPSQPAGGRVVIRARSGQQDATVASADLTTEERGRLRHLRQGEPLFRARFEVAFVAGRNEVAVEYLQPLGADEEGHGYFKDGALLRRWDYELWPIREWRRAPDFAIDVVVTVPRKPPSLWQRWFGTVESVACDSFGGSGESARAAKSTRQVGEQLEYRTSFRGQFPLPDRLRCAWGDEDHLPN